MRDICLWEQDEAGVWETDCGHEFELSNHETPRGNGFEFCPYCGARLEEDA